jgi:hypothetical protein
MQNVPPKQPINFDREPSAQPMGRARPERSLRSNTLPLQSLVRTGGAVTRSSAQALEGHPSVRSWDGGNARAPSEARLGAFARQARVPARCGSGEKGKAWRSWMNGEARIQDAKAPSRAFCGAPRKEDSSIWSSRPEILPKPRPSAVCAAKENGAELFRAARQGGGFCFRFCRAFCLSKNRARAEVATEQQQNT